VALSSGRLIQMVSNALVGLFLPIFIYIKVGHRIDRVLIFYGATWLLYAVFLPVGVRLLNRFGLKRALVASVFFDALVYVFLFNIDRAPLLFLTLAGLARTINMLLFWIPYHVDFAKFTSRRDRGREYSFIMAGATIIGIVMPVIAGALISRYSFNFVFLLEIIATMFELIPFMMLPRTRESFCWSYRETLKHFFCRPNRKLIIAHMASGAENVVSFLIWPIFIFLLLDGQYLKVGIISSLISAATVLLQLAIGNWTDKFDKRKLIRTGSFLYSIGWVVKAIIATAFQIFIAGVYHSFADIVMRTPFDSLNYEIAADQGHYVDEYTVIKEMAVQSGRVIMILVVVVLLGFSLALQWVFLLAAFASLAFNLIPEEELLDIHEKMAIKKNLSQTL
jgi:YQGE family putative transporter